jgi:hypothetical protein
MPDRFSKSGLSCAELIFYGSIKVESIFRSNHTMLKGSIKQMFYE